MNTCYFNSSSPSRIPSRFSSPDAGDQLHGSHEGLRTGAALGAGPEALSGGPMGWVPTMGVPNSWMVLVKIPIEIGWWRAPISGLDIRVSRWKTWKSRGSLDRFADFIWFLVYSEVWGMPSHHGCLQMSNLMTWMIWGTPFWETSNSVPW